MRIDTKSLINEVEKRPHLWNPTTREYRLRDSRMASWMDICAKVVSNFDEMDSKAKDKMVLKVRTRWKTARDTFMKISNNLKGRTKKANRYYYFEQLQFLKQIKRMKEAYYPPQTPIIDDKDLSLTETPEIKEEEITIKVEHDSSDEITVSETVVVPANDESTNYVSTFDVSTNYISTNDASTNDVSTNDVSTDDVSSNDVNTDYAHINDLSTNDVSTNYVSTHDVSTNSVSTNEEDDDRAFLTSLLPTLRKFDDNQKLSFRLDVLRIVMHIKNSQNIKTTSQHFNLL